MRYEISQAELREAIQYYLNEKVLQRPVEVKSVSPVNDSPHNRYGDINYVLHVVVEDTQAHVSGD